MEKLNFEQMELVEGGGEDFGTDFMCGMVTSGIGTIYGFWGGAITAVYLGAGIVSGGVTIGISLVASAVLGALVC